jgi:hypothetical protein
MKKLFLSLILILLVSGCVLPFDIPFFQSSGPEVKELPPDVISIQNITVLPSSSVRVEDQFSILLEVTNQDEFDEIDVDYNLYDTGLCDVLGGYPVDISTRQGDFDTFAPRETVLVEWNFEAPTTEEIASISLICPIRFRFDFSYNATSQIDLVVIDSEHLRELQRAGEITSFKPSLNIGRGPIKIYFDYGTSLPIKDESPLSIYITVEDKGTGLLRKIELDDEFNIIFPAGFDLSDANCPLFDCSGSVNSGWTCENNDDIYLTNKKTMEMRCANIITPSLFSDAPEKTYFITAELEYEYYAVGEVDVEVKP